MEKNRITKIILDLLLEYEKKGITPFDINNGNCEEFAYKVLEKLPKAIIKETDWLTSNVGHFYLFYNKKYYDAETIYGMENYWELPIFKRTAVKK